MCKMSCFNNSKVFSDLSSQCGHGGRNPTILSLISRMPSQATEQQTRARKGGEQDSSRHQLTHNTHPLTHSLCSHKEKTRWVNGFMVRTGSWTETHTQTLQLRLKMSQIPHLIIFKQVLISVSYLCPVHRQVQDVFSPA